MRSAFSWDIPSRTFTGKNYKACKYWKVYDDVQLSEKLFAQIDLAKTNALQSLKAVCV